MNLLQGATLPPDDAGDESELPNEEVVEDLCGTTRKGTVATTMRRRQSLIVSSNIDSKTALASSRRVSQLAAPSSFSRAEDLAAQLAGSNPLAVNNNNSNTLSNQNSRNPSEGPGTPRTISPATTNNTSVSDGKNATTWRDMIESCVKGCGGAGDLSSAIEESLVSRFSFSMPTTVQQISLTHLCCNVLPKGREAIQPHRDVRIASPAGCGKSTAICLAVAVRMSVVSQEPTTTMIVDDSGHRACLVPTVLVVVPGRRDVSESMQTIRSIVGPSRANLLLALGIESMQDDVSACRTEMDKQSASSSSCVVIVGTCSRLADLVKKGVVVLKKDRTQAVFVDGLDEMAAQNLLTQHVHRLLHVAPPETTLVFGTSSRRTDDDGNGVEETIRRFARNVICFEAPSTGREGPGRAKPIMTPPPQQRIPPSREEEDEDFVVVFA